MKRRLWSPLCWLLGAALAPTLVACSAAPVRYYTLANAAQLPAATQVAHQPAGTARIYFEVAPVGVPERLARPQMVVRNGSSAPSTRVDVLEQQRWSSSFESELRDALATAIASRLGGVDVTRGGRLPGEPVYRVAVRLRHFDATVDEQVDARFGWTITRSDDDRNAVCQSVWTQEVGPGMDALVRGIGRVVARTADLIAAQIARLQAAQAITCDA